MYIMKCIHGKYLKFFFLEANAYIKVPNMIELDNKINIKTAPLKIRLKALRPRAHH